ncbi:hypothetical protein Bbelb_078380, partial [Branchiostoma belcheri]
MPPSLYQASGGGWTPSRSLVQAIQKPGVPTIYPPLEGDCLLLDAALSRGSPSEAFTYIHSNIDNSSPVCILRQIKGYRNLKPADNDVRREVGRPSRGVSPTTHGRLNPACRASGDPAVFGDIGLELPAAVAFPVAVERKGNRSRFFSQRLVKGGRLCKLLSPRARGRQAGVEPLHIPAIPPVERPMRPGLDYPEPCLNESRSVIQSAMTHWQRNTCVRFRPRMQHDFDYVFFQRGRTCCSFVGRTGNGKQTLSVGPGCDMFGIVLHEIGHLIGFWHEHSRPDRDEFVDILYENVKDGERHNFEKLWKTQINSLGQRYDYMSIMHYGSRYFTKNGRETLSPRQNNVMIGQRTALSQMDIVQANLLYKCHRGSLKRRTNVPLFYESMKMPKVETKVMAKFAALLELRVPISILVHLGKTTWHVVGCDCGGTIFANSGNFTSPNYPNELPSNIGCAWIVTSEEGNTLTLNVTDMDLQGADEDGECRNEYIEIRDGMGELAPLIGRFCGNDTPTSIASSGRSLWLQLVSRGPPAPPVDGTTHYSVSRGFLVNFEPGGVCERTLTETSGRIKSPMCERTLTETSGRIKSPSNYRLTILVPMILMTNLSSDTSRPQCVSGPLRRLCERTLTETSGRIKSPSNIETSLQGIDCAWQIVVPEGYYVALTIEDVQLPGYDRSDQCHLHFVEVQDGNSTDSTTINRLCHSSQGVGLISSGSQLRIILKSSPSLQHASFSASYTAIDIDECMSDNGGCQEACLNLDGGYACGCSYGYEIAPDGTSCVDIDECLTSDNNGGCSHLCVNTEGGYHCDCPQGFTLAHNKSTCYDNNECAEVDLIQCEHRCLNTVGGYRCSCHAGYVLAMDGKRCE